MAETSAARFTADRSAPARARKWLSESIRLDPIRAAEAGLLVSEVVTGALLANGEDTQLLVEIRPASTGAVIAVSAEGGTPIGRPDELSSSLLDTFARRWAHDEAADEIWFEVRTPGGVTESLQSRSNEELLLDAPTDLDARDEVIRRFTPLALGIARRYRGKGISQDDLEQVALLGMLRALDRYDPTVGSFEPFASKTISGELKRQLRDRAWSVRVPRSLQERSLEVTRTSQELTQRLGRAPTTADIAEAMDITVSEVLEARGASSAYTSASLDAPLDEDSGWSLADSLGGDDEALALADRWHGLGPALASLPERERKILYLRFYEDMTQSEIAEIVGVSQMHVSRLLARAIDRLKTLVD